MDQATAQQMARVHKMISCPSKSAAVRLVKVATSDGDDEMIDDTTDSAILTQDEVKLYRGILEVATGKRAEEATAHLRAHEIAVAARDATKPLDDIQLVGLQPTQVLPRVEAKLAELQQKKADDQARWLDKEREDDSVVDELVANLKDWVKFYQDKLEDTLKRRKDERAKWAALHADQSALIDAKILEVTKLLEVAKKDPASLVAPPKPAQAEAAEAEGDVKMTVSDAKHMAEAVKVEVRPLAALPQIALKDDAQLARLATAQAVIDQAAQQDVHVDLALRDLGLSAEEVATLIGVNEWREKSPADGPQPEADWPLHKRILALVQKAVSRIEISTAVEQTAQRAAATAIAQATEAGKAWQVVTGTRRPKPY
jgi:hypothetical protein